jgi:hypothetical protein
MKDQVPTSAKVEFALEMHHFQEIIKAQQATIDQIREANRGKKDIKEGVQKEGDQGFNEAKQEET